MTVIDITGTIEEGMWSYRSPITPPRIEHIAAVDGPAGYDAHRISVNTITATYLEASAHLYINGQTIDQVEPSRFFCPASLVKLPDCAARYPITRADLIAAAHTPPPQGGAALVATGWDRMWHQPNYLVDSPFFTMEAMEWLIATGVSIIGGDIPTFDNAAQKAGVNFKLFAAGCLILAPLVNLRAVPTSEVLNLVALPLKVKGVCGTPCRAVIITQDGKE